MRGSAHEDVDVHFEWEAMDWSGSGTDEGSPVLLDNSRVEVMVAARSRRVRA